jgi:hypothetical protein
LASAFLQNDLKRTREPYPKLQNLLILFQIREDTKKHTADAATIMFLTISGVLDVADGESAATQTALLPYQWCHTRLLAKALLSAGS